MYDQVKFSITLSNVILLNNFVFILIYKKSQY